VKRADFLLLVAVLVLTLSVRAWAAPGTIRDLLGDRTIVVDRQPTRYGGLASDTLFINRSGQVSWQQLADSITLSQAATNLQLGWWGFYGSFDQTHQPPSGAETFRVRFYDARASDGLPGSTIFEQTFDSASRAATGHTVFAEVTAPEYFYQVDLAQGLALEAGAKYWIEVVQVSDIDSAFRWEFATGGPPGEVYLNAHVSDWTLYGPDTAFQLSTLPEPASLLFFVPSILLVKLRGRREARRP